MLLVGGGVLGVVLVPLVPEPVAGLVLDPLGVLVLLPMVEPVIELSLPVPPVPVPYVPVLPVVDPLVVAELSVAWVPGAGVAVGLVAVPDVLVAVPERDPVSEAQAPSSSPPAPSAAQSQSLFIFMRVPPVRFTKPANDGSGKGGRFATRRARFAGLRMVGRGGSQRA